MGVGEAGVQATCGAADHGCHEGVLLGEVHAVEDGLGDAHEGGDGAGACGLLDARILGAERDDETSGCLAHVRDDVAGTPDAVIAELGHLHDAEGSDAVVQAEHDHDRAESADEDRGSPSGVLGEEGEDGRERLAGEVAEGAEDGEREGAHDDERDHGDEHEVDRLGDVLVEELLHVGLDEYDQDDGDDARSVARERERNHAEEVDGVTRRDERRPVGVQHHGRDTRSEDGIALELLGLAEREQDREEVEDAVREEVEHVVGLRGLVDEVEDDEKGHDGLDHAGAGEGGDDRLERARDEVDDDLEHALLLGGCRVGVGRLDVEKRLDFLVDVSHLRPDHDLELPTRPKHADDAIELLYGGLVSLGFVGEREAHAGLAVERVGDVLLASHEPHDVLGEGHVLFAHAVPPSICF